MTGNTDAEQDATAAERLLSRVLTAPASPTDPPDQLEARDRLARVSLLHAATMRRRATLTQKAG